jgi:hypothetical protein
MDRGVDIPWVRGSIYHGKGVDRNGGGQNTMRVQFTIQGGSVFNKGVQYTMDVN